MPRKTKQTQLKLFDAGLLKVISVWSLIPSYLVAGGVIGYTIDRLIHTFPYLTGACLLAALGLAVRDMLRLRDELF